MNIQALNFKQKSLDSFVKSTVPRVTKEAEEARAVQLHLDGLKHLNEGDLSSAKDSFLALLKSPFITDSRAKHIGDPENSKGTPLDRVSLKLEYSCLKNLGLIALEESDDKTALSHFLQACQLDNTDVTLLHHLASTAMRLGDFMVARQALEQNVHLSPSHWPSLSTLCRLLFGIEDYPACLKLLLVALEVKDDFEEGICYIQWIVKERPYLCHGQSEIWKYLSQPTPGAYNKVMEDVRLLRSREHVEPIPTSKSPSTDVKLTQPHWLDVGRHLQQVYRHCIADKSSLHIHIPLESMFDYSDLEKECVEMDESDMDSVQESASDLAGKESEVDVKVGVKRRIPDFPVDYIPKRRSSRVKPTRKSVELSSVWEKIKNFVPPHMKLDIEDWTNLPCLMSHHKHLKDDVSDDTTRAERTVKRIHENELVEVPKFVEGLHNNRGVVDLMFHYVLHLSEKWDVLWSKELKQEFINCVFIVIEHIQLPASFGPLEETEEQYCLEIGSFLLLFVELWTDHKRKKQFDGKGGEELLVKSISFLQGTLPWMAPKGLMLSIRLFWCLAQLYGDKKDDKIVLELLDKCKDTLVLSDMNVLQLPNFTSAPLLSQSTIDKKINLCAQTAAMVKICDFYCEEEYDSVANSLLQAICEGQVFYKEILHPPVGVLGVRETWLDMLLTALHNLDRKKESLCVGAEGLKYLLSEECSVTDRVWYREMGTIFKELDWCLSGDCTLLSTSECQQILLLVVKSIDIICDHGSIPVPASFPVVAPWLVIYNILSKLKTLPVADLSEDVTSPISHSGVPTVSVSDSALLPTTVSEDTPSTSGLETTIPVTTVSESTSLTTAVIDNVIPTAAVLKSTATIMDSSNSPTTVTSVGAMPDTTEHAIVGSDSDPHSDVPELVSGKSARPTADMDSTQLPMDCTVLNQQSCEKQGEPEVTRPETSLWHYLEFVHQHLASYGWCCKEEGRLLKLYVDVIKKEQVRAVVQSEKEDLSEALYQCYRCLYGFPLKTDKGKKLLKHVSEPFNLTWSVALELLTQFHPPQLPRSWETKHNTTQYADLLTLYANAVDLIPKQLAIATVVDKEALLAYLNGRLSYLAPYSRPSHKLSQLLAEVYYVLADDCLQRSDFKNAYSNYFQSLCHLPTMDYSWIGLSLSISKELLNKFTLESFDFTSDHLVLNVMPQIIRCLNKTMLSGNTIVIEHFGLLLQCIHSYASQLVKQGNLIDSKLLKWASEDRVPILELAGECFLQLMKMPPTEHSKEWFRHYMSAIVTFKLEGKISDVAQYLLSAQSMVCGPSNPLPKTIELSSKHPAIIGAVLSCHFYTFTLKTLLRSSTDCSEVVSVLQSQLSTVAINPEHTPSGTQWVKRIISEIIQKIRATLGQEEQMDSHTPGSASTVESTKQEEEHGAMVEIPQDNNKQEDCVSKWTNVIGLSKSELENLLSASPSTSDAKVSHLMRIAQNIHAVCVCLDGIASCALRFPNYSTPLYQLSKFVYRVGLHKESFKLLVGPLPDEFVASKDQHAVPPLALKSNIFANMWKLPVKELDCPGVFFSFTRKQLDLLLDILHSMDDLDSLLFVFQQIKNKPDYSRIYMRDCDRLWMTRKCVQYCSNCLKSVVEKLSKSDGGLPNMEELVTLTRKVQGLKKSISRISGLPTSIMETIKNCLKKLPSREDVAKWKSTQPSVSEEKLAQSNVSEEKLAQPRVSEEKLAQPNASEEKLAQPRVSEEKLAQPNVSEEKLAQPNVSEEELAQPNVSKEKLAQPNVSEEELAQPRVSEEKLVRPSVSEQKLVQPNASEEKLMETVMLTMSTSESSLDTMDQ